MVEFRAAQLGRPPDAGILHVFGDGDHLRFTGGEAGGDAEFTSFISAFHGALDSLFAQVHQGDLGLKGCLGEIGRIYDGLHEDVLHLNVRGGDEGDGTDDAHALVHGTGVPVHVAGVEVSLLRTAEGDLEGVAGLDGTGDVEFPDGVGAEGFIGLGDDLSVELNVGVVVETFEAEYVTKGRAGLELGGKYPGAVEDALVDGLVAVFVQDIGTKVTGFIEHAGHGAGHLSFVHSVVSLALERPVFEGACPCVHAQKDCGQKDNSLFHRNGLCKGSRAHQSSVLFGHGNNL